MGLIIKPKSWVDAENVTFTDLDSNFDTLYNEFNGNIDNANIKPSAGITLSKLDPATVASVATAQTFTGKKTFTGTIQTITADPDGSTITFDLNASNIHKVTLAGNRTLILANPSVGQAFVIELTQDGTGSRLATWFAGISWPGGTVPTLTTTAGKTDIFGFICIGTDLYQGTIVGQNY